jgi:hypothetical protein
MILSCGDGYVFVPLMLYQIEFDTAKKMLVWSLLIDADAI